MQTIDIEHPSIVVDASASRRPIQTGADVAYSGIPVSNIVALPPPAYEDAINDRMCLKLYLFI